MNDQARQYQFLFDNMTHGAFFQDADGRLVDVNQAALEILGLSRDQFLGRSAHDSVWQVIDLHGSPLPPEKYPSVVSLQSGECIRDFVAGVYHPHKQEFVWLQISSTPLFRQGEARPFRVFATLYDITIQRQAEASLRDSEERYRRFIATANEGIGISNSSYIITYVNRCLAEMLGYDENELIGRHVHSLLPPDELCSFSTTMSERHQGLSGQRECRHRRKDGSVIWLLTSSTPILDDVGAFQGCFAMFTDLTDLKKAEVVLQRANDELELRVAERTSALARANDQILKISFELVRAQEQERSRIAAELHDQVGQTLLLAKMKLDMLASKTGSPVESNYIENVVTLLESTIHDIRTLTFSMRPPLLETAGLEAALEWLCTSIENDYNLQIEFCRICRPISLAGEQRYSFFQAVRELLLNVAKHAGVDRAKLSLYSENNNLIVRVSDEGKGFSEKGESPCTESSRGFGLFNVQQRIELLGGSIAIVTSPGKGTAVTLTVPLENQRREREPWN